MNTEAVKLIVVMLALASTTFAECGSNKQERNEKVLIEMENRWVAALDHRDPKTLDCLLADEFVDSDANGQLRTRPQVLEAVPTRKTFAQHLEDLRATLYGDIGIVHGVNRINDKDGKEVARVRFTDVFRYKNGQWRAVSGHETIVRPAEEKSPSSEKSKMDLEISPHETKKMLEHGEKFIILDVREPWEFQTAHIQGAKLIPMGDVPSRAHQELDPDERIVVVCHHGVRSLNVASWLRQQGFEQAQSMRGGIDQWSRQVDAKVPVY